MKSNKIYIIQMHTHTMPSRLIKLFTHYKYSHIAISLTPKCDKIYSFGRKELNSIINSGFVIENRDGDFFNKFNETTCRIFEIEVTKKQYRNLKKIIKYMKIHSDLYKYDFIGIVLRFLKIPVCFKNRYVCSFFVADVLEKAHICKFNKKSRFVEPKDFEKIDGVKQVYEGKYLLMNENT